VGSVLLSLAAHRKRLKIAAGSAEAQLLGGVLCVGAGLWAILSLGGEVTEGETGAFDRRILMALRLSGRPHVAIGPQWLSEALRDVTALGGTTFVALATLLASAALVFHQSWRRAWLLIAVVATAQITDEWLKAVYNRPRPDFAVAGIYTYAQSFPSGHSTASAALWFSLATIAASFERSSVHKAFWFAVAGLVIAAVGFSRIYLGVHWPTDVVAGWFLGASFALAGWLAVRSRRPVRVSRPNPTQVVSGD
jgi:undecaprenyl-diphosphatase